MPYHPRIADGELAAALRRSGAVLIEGPKACGKTATASEFSASAAHLDTDPSIGGLISVDPALVLEGGGATIARRVAALPPELWNAVRREVDQRGERGQFILTGSTAPAANSVRHSGAGRFARLRMRTMSLFESGHSDGRVSLGALLDGGVAEGGRAVTRLSWGCSNA